MIRPPVAFAHPRQRQSAGVEHRRQVDGEDGVPFLHRELIQRRHVLNAGVVHQNVHAAELAFGILHHVRYLARIAEIGAVIPRRGAQPRDLRLRLLHVAEAVEDHARAGGGQHGRYPEADAAGRAGHQRGFALYTHGIAPLNNAGQVEHADHEQHRGALDQG